ncbi:MAG TPA: rhomboid family intramembrane serine protease [Actinomycetota bacterium]|jgi:membrane associated rhomboid family serine protease|nr:rhomboid family intramembrane serine protease [Actinomycetota bacterium]
MDDQTGLPAAPQLEHCYRHPGEETLVHCTRCGRPICPQCMIPAPVGHHCPECVAEARREFRQGPGRKMAIAGFSFTKAILAAILAVYVIEVSKGGAGSLFEGPFGQQLFDLGADFPPAIALLGQYWRFVTAMFLHIGLIHLAFNCYALWLLGTQVERDFGRASFLGIYFLAGILGSVGSYAFGDPLAVGAGASGAVFGLMGAFLAYNYVRRNQTVARMNLQWVWQILALNLILAITIRAIDFRAHLGGLVAGVAAGYLLDRERVRISPAFRALGLVALIGVGVALVAWRNADLRSQLPPDLFRAFT